MISGWDGGRNAHSLSFHPQKYSNISTESQISKIRFHLNLTIGRNVLIIPRVVHHGFSHHISPIFHHAAYIQTSICNPPRALPILLLLSSSDKHHHKQERNAAPRSILLSYLAVHVCHLAKPVLLIFRSHKASSTLTCTDLEEKT